MDAGSNTIYYLARDGEPIGEKVQADVISDLRRGRLRRTDLAWTEGMPEWQPIASIPDLMVEAEVPTSTLAGAYVSPLPVPATELSRQLPEKKVEPPPYASVGARLLGALVDVSIFLAVVLGPAIAIDGVDAVFDEKTDLSSTALIAVGVSFLVLAITQLVLISRRGQSLGKVFAKTRIHLEATGEQAGFLNAILLRSFVGGLPTNIPLIGMVYWLVDCCFVFRSDHRCIHDLIGGTIVLRAS
ncbi:MAG: RDD family protein [Verrucomicrobiales bacterium]|nr:RDD family protein [Verrucomicrobiales bacterium]